MEQPTCDHIPLWGTSEHRCTRPAYVRVLRRHNAGIDPIYKDRCLIHARAELGPRVAAVWDAEDERWGATD